MGGRRPRAGVGEVLVEEVVHPEAALERDELLSRVALKADEKQAGVELPPVVHAVGKREAAAQDLLSVAALPCEPDVCVLRD